MTNYARIARNDDETFSDEAEFVAKRRDELVEEWRDDHKRLFDAVMKEMEDDYDGIFPNAIAHFFSRVTLDSESKDDAAAAGHLYSSLSWSILSRLSRDAETAAQAEYDSRLLGPEPYDAE